MMSLLTRADDAAGLKHGQLETRATHIVTGTVKRVYTSEREKEKGVTDYVIEIEVDKVTRGKGPKEGEVLYMRCWKRNKKSNDPKVSNGQSEIPRVGRAVKAYLKRAPDGGYDILETSGVIPQPTAKPK
jgi:hypothetical protein